MTPVHYHRLMTPMTFIADISFFTVLWGLILNIGPCGLHSPLTTRWVMFFLQALLTFLTFSQAPCCDDLLNNATLDACREVAYWSMQRPNCPQSILFIPVTLCCLCFLLSWSVFNEELHFFTRCKDHYRSFPRVIWWHTWDCEITSLSKSRLLQVWSWWVKLHHLDEDEWERHSETPLLLSPLLVFAAASISLGSDRDQRLVYLGKSHLDCNIKRKALTDN